MVTDDRLCRIVFADWICVLRRDKDPDYDVKVETIKEIMNRFGVEGMDKFDDTIDEVWRRHFLHEQPKRWIF